MNRLHRLRPRTGLILLFVGATALFGFAATNGPVLSEAALVRQVDLSSGYEYPGLVWLDAERIVALRRPLETERAMVGKDELVWMSVTHPDTAEPLAVLPTRGCPLTNLRYPRRVDAHRFAVIRVCQADVPGKSLNLVSLIDISTGTMDDLTEWVPVNQLISMALTPRSLYPMIVVTMGRYAYWVREAQVVNELGQNILDLGYEGVNALAWSPDGSRIAYAGVFHPGQISPSDADIVLANGDLTEPVVLLSGIQLPFNLQWSGTGKWLAFRGRVGGGLGVWAIEVSSRALYRVWNEPDEFAWKPGSDTELVIIRPGGGSTKDEEPALLFLKLPE